MDTKENILAENRWHGKTANEIFETIAIGKNSKAIFPDNKWRGG